MLDAVLILPSEGVHRFDCNLGWKLEISPFCRLNHCFKKKNQEEKKELLFLFGFDLYG